MADRVTSHINTFKGILEVVGLGVSRRIKVHQILAQISAERNADDGMVDGVGSDNMLRCPGMGPKLISIGVVDGVEINCGMVVIGRTARQGIHQLVHMDGLHDVSVAVIVADAQLQHQRIQDGRYAETLSCQRQTELRIETCLRITKDRVFHAAQQRITDILCADRVFIGMALDFDCVGMENADIVTVGNQVVANGLRRLPASRKSQQQHANH